MDNTYIFAAAAMLCWGVAPVFGKLGLTTLDPLAALMLRSGMVTAILLMVVVITGKWGAVFSVSAKEAAWIGAEGICAALLGQLAYYYALKYGSVGQVSPMVSAFPLVALICAVLFLGETFSVLKVLGALAIVVGLILLKL